MKKKISPVFLVIGLIVLVIIAGGLSVVIHRYAPSTETMDGKQYFQLTSDEEAALVVNHVLEEEKGKMIDGRYYIPDAAVGKYINGRFYWDEKKEQMLYTLPTEELQILPERQEYQNASGVQKVGYTILKKEGDTCYLDLEFIKAFSDLEYEVYENPNRIVIRTDWEPASVVQAEKKGALRQKGGIKSTIVTEVVQGDMLYLEEKMENWSKVSTKDGYTGYMENKKLSGESREAVDHTSTEPEYTSIRKDYRIHMAWHQVTSKEGNSTLESMVADAQGLNTISPTWFSVIDNSGTISTLADKAYVDQAHARGLEVWALIDNFSKNADTLTFLSDTDARAHIIDQLMEQAAATGLDGINLDFESITEEQGPHYVQFIRELSIACRKAGLVFSIDDPVPMPYTKHYNRKEQGKVADYVIVMGYDEHHSGDSEAGSVASLEFTRNGIEDTLKEVPAEKVIHAIPFYTRVWIEPFGGGNLTSEVLGMDGTTNYIKEHNMDTYWDDVSGQTVAIAEESDSMSTIWVEDEQSIGEKMKVIQEHQLAGVAEWKLGFERASIWPVISQYLQ